MKMIYASIILIVITLLIKFLTSGGLLLFFFSALTIIPLAGVLGKATEEIAARHGSSIGGLLNATFGNATELIIAIMALRQGYMDVVKASLTGSVIGNLLLVLGASLVAGGMKYKTMKFNTNLSNMNSSMLLLAILGLMVPALYYHTHPEKTAGLNIILEDLSIGVSVVLILIYIASLIFSLYTHKHIFHSHDEEEKPEWSQTKAIIILVLSAVFIGLESEFLVGTLEHVVKSIGWTETFIGVIIVAIVGNAAEHGVAVIMAMKNKVDLSLNICLSSSTQIALFVAPLLVFISLLFGKPMDLLFKPFEILAIIASVYTVGSMATDGEFNWFEGTQLLGVYIIMGVVFYFVD